MLHEADTVRLLVKACVLLHNLMRTRYPVMQNRLVDWERPDGALEETRPDRVPGPNRDARLAKAQRNLTCSGATPPLEVCRGRMTCSSTISYVY